AGKWYRIEREFALSVKRSVKALVASSPRLPQYALSDKDETGYNQRACGQSKDLALVDRKNIMYGGGRSRFEVCDLYSRARHMIHVKRYGNSAPLSHLFAQGANAAMLWMSDSSFRKA